MKSHKILCSLLDKNPDKFWLNEENAKNWIKWIESETESFPEPVPHSYTMKKLEDTVELTCNSCGKPILKALASQGIVVEYPLFCCGKRRM